MRNANVIRVTMIESVTFVKADTVE